MTFNMDQIEKAIELLNANEVVAIPTETVYGLAAKINSVVALNKIFSITYSSTEQYNN